MAIIVRMPSFEEPSDVAIRLAAVEAAGRRVAPADPVAGYTEIADHVVRAADQIARWIKTGNQTALVEW